MRAWEQELRLVDPGGLRADHMTATLIVRQLIHCCRRMRAWERELRVGLIWAAFIALTLFYAIPVGAVQALVEVDRLQNIPVFKQLLRITFIRALLQSVFPSAPSTLQCIVPQSRVQDVCAVTAAASSSTLSLCPSADRAASRQCCFRLACNLQRPQQHRTG